MESRKIPVFTILFMILMMIMIIFSQLAMEIYAYNFAVNKNIEKISILNYKKYITEKFLKDMAGNKNTGAEKTKTLAETEKKFCMPVENGVTTSVFGDRESRLSVHMGHDWAVKTGTKVIAVADGIVEKAYYSKSYGYNVLVRHNDGIETRYAHMSKLSVSQGQYVHKRQKLGLSGSTGDSTGPHLHFEVIEEGVRVNPLNYFQQK